MDDGLTLFPPHIRERLLLNGSAGRRGLDHAPVVRIFSPVGAATWLLTEAETEDGDDILFGLCDLGMGCPELGGVLRSELESVRMPQPFSSLGLEVAETDRGIRVRWGDPRRPDR